MKIAVIGCGRWGSFIAWYLDKIGNEVTLYGRETSEKMKNFLENRKNNFLELPKSISLTTNINDVFDKDLIIISVGTQGLRDLLNENKALFKEKNIPIILCMKGIEIKTGFTPTKIVKDILGENYSCGAWIGPGHVQDFTNGIPNCMVIDSDDRELVKKLVDSFSSNLIRFYYGTNLLGNEIGAASKNVIGIAAGMLDGFNLSSLKGALMSRGTREIARLIEKMGGDKNCAYGLCHLGDYEATVFSEFSNNRKFGEKFVKGESFEKLAEGYFTTKALMDLSEKYDVELPITNAVYEIIYNKKNPKEILDNLFKRSIKMEF
ncbi:NAD(P)H-dependent glycerol-3-phosphate dehydrogenase [Parvimonas micra]